jgi:4,5-DOPA dioxygenase extradiol
VTTSPRPPTLHDFGGFPEALYRIRYPAPGDPALAAEVLEALQKSGLQGTGDPRRGLDHGAWVPLHLMFPDAGVPVVQLSVQSDLGPAHHRAIGRALRPLRERGILVLGSGGATHDLGAFGAHAVGDPPAAYAAAFDAWLCAAVEAGREDDLLDYARRAPEARRNHPTPEHFLPLFVPLGAAGDAAGRRIHAAFTYGVISMAAFAWS